MSDKTGEMVEWHWLDHHSLTFTNWGEDQPSKDTGCVYINYDSSWVAVVGSICDQKLPYICKFDPDNRPEEHNDPGVDNCDQGWIAHSGYCYYSTSISDQKQRADNAQETCEKRQGTLITIHSDLDRRFLASLTQDQDLSSSSHWIGLTRNEYGGFGWFDESGLDFTAWEIGAPDNGKDLHGIKSTGRPIWL